MNRWRSGRRLRALGALVALVAVAVAVPAVLELRGSSHAVHASAAAAAKRTAGGTGVLTTDDQTQSGGFLGVSVNEQNGAVTVQNVVSGGPADKAGVKNGDVITAVDGTAVHTAQDLTQALNGKKAGDNVTLTVQRSGTSQQLQVTLGSRGANSRAAGSGRGVLGVTVQTATDADKQQWKLTTTDGALISAVQPGSGAATAGLQQGDLITSVNGTTVKNVADLTAALQNAKPGDSVTVQYQRAGNTANANVTLAAPNGPAGAAGARPGRGRAGGFPGLPGMGAALGGNFDRFISNEAKVKDANGTVHTDTTIGGTVKSATDTSVTVTPNGGGGDQTFTIDANTHVLGRLGRKGTSSNGANGAGNTGSNATQPKLNAGDHVLVTVRDGAKNATVIVVVPVLTGTPGGAGSSNGGSSTAPLFPGGNGPIRINIPGGGQITFPGGNVTGGMNGQPSGGQNGGRGSGQQGGNSGQPTY
jgi:membrane-associated protease RseP (regulator of RpoE activity)